MLNKQLTILAVDDDADFMDYLKEALELEDYRVVTACNGNDALELFKDQKPSLILLDVMLPDIDGCVVCKRIRKISSVPIIIVSGKASEEEKVVGLDSGADDYITKPFHVKEFLARIRAASRREALPHDDMGDLSFCCNDLCIKYKQRVATMAGRNLDLTATEYRILAFLAENANRVVSSEEILSEIWCRKPELDDHLVKVNIGRLRQKLGDDKGLKYIQTRQGMGYIIEQIA
jgi:DNA-binding response OmpR family regulator